MTPCRRALPHPLDQVFRWLQGHAPRAAARVGEAWVEDDALAEAMLTGLLPIYRAHQRAERQRRRVEAQ